MSYHILQPLAVLLDSLLCVCAFLVLGSPNWVLSPRCALADAKWRSGIPSPDLLAVILHHPGAGSLPVLLTPLQLIHHLATRLFQQSCFLTTGARPSQVQDFVFASVEL